MAVQRTVRELEQAGVAGIIIEMRAVRESVAHLKEHGSSIGIKDRLATVGEYFSAVELERYLEMEQEIMRPK